MLKTGDKCPKIKGLIAENSFITNSDLKGQDFILYFYPKDNTSGCTKEACEFNENISVFNSLNIKVIGVSPDSLKSHTKFKEKYNLNFDLISDPENEISKSFFAYGEKSMYGRKYMGIIRSTFLIDKKGIIREVWYKVKVNGHVDNVKKAINELNIKN